MKTTYQTAHNLCIWITIIWWKNMNCMVGYLFIWQKSKKYNLIFFQFVTHYEIVNLGTKSHQIETDSYSKVPNKRSATFINFRKIFQGVRLLVLIKCFLKVRKVWFKIPNSMKIILFQEGVRLLEGGMLIVSAQISRGYIYLEATLIRNSRVDKATKS